MNEFQYNGTPQEQAMADLLKTQGHRLARQQIVPDLEVNSMMEK